jgi:galactokinase/CTP:molybdopterin cytidylyltransferase MocA
LLASKIQLASIGALAHLESCSNHVDVVDIHSSALEYFNREQSGENLSSITLIFLLQRIYGVVAYDLISRLQSLASVCNRFVELFGDGPVGILHAPARIGILGEHIDYVSYLPTSSLTVGSREHDMILLYRASEAPRVRGASTDQRYPPFDFHFGDEASNSSPNDSEVDWLSYLYSHPNPSPHWANYVKGAVEFARMKWGSRLSRGVDFLVDSTMPASSGASSSSALVVLASASIRESNNITYTADVLARDASKAEWYVGTRGGTMDHITICLARLHHAVLIDYKKDRARSIKHPGNQFRWVTFFSIPAEKSRAVMVEYNERAAVARVIIPALISAWEVTEPDHFRAWQQTIEAIETGSSTAIDIAEGLLETLPEMLTFDQIQHISSEALEELRRSFPALVDQRKDAPLQVRARALHHIREIRRVVQSTAILESIRQDEMPATDEETDSLMHSLGKSLNDSHASLRDLYGVSTPEIEEMVKIIRSDANVYGVRLMGGGFGGNVLALTRDIHVPKLIEKVQNEYYRPRQRNALKEGSIMVSTAGDGLRPLEPEIVWRQAVEEFNGAVGESQYRNGVLSLLDHIHVTQEPTEVWPIVVAAGAGTRAQRTGLEVPKPLASVLGVPSIVHVIRNIRTALGERYLPIVIVSPDTEGEVRTALADEKARYVLQKQALGTGDAVLCAQDVLSGFDGEVLVVWSTQPTIRLETIHRTLTLATLFSEYEMVLPTTVKKFPYAPLLRDENGRVKTAHETHLEKFQRQEFGETNIGLFALKSESMFETLLDLKTRYWNESRQCYDRPGGELGFPNELISMLSARETGVLACPIADSNEEQGIKERDDIARCEKIILEYRQGNQGLC